MFELVQKPFFEFAIILIISTIVGAIGRLLKQPLIVSFILAGILVGPSAFNLIMSHEQIHLLAEVGISILLFVVGLKLDIKLIRLRGVVALLTGLGQVIFTSVFGFLIGIAIGFSNLEALYIAIALTFSSTIIIVKLLSDKKEIDSLHGQIAVGFLIVQDIVVVIIMIFLSALAAGTEVENQGYAVAIVFLKGIAVIAFVALLMKRVLPWLLHQMASTPELLVLFSIAWAVFLAAMGDLLGFSKEVGAFLAGISLASTHYRETISGRLTSLRDFLLLFFFINLGAQLDLSLLGDQIIPSIIFSLFVLIGNPIVVLIIMGLMGYRKRTSFLAGLTVAQISEFSLILAAMGFTLGHIEAETMGLITMVGLITIGISTYMIIYSAKLYNLLSPMLSVFEKKVMLEKEDINNEKEIDTIIFGLGRYGNNIAKSLINHNNYKILGIDFDPKLVRRWTKKGSQAFYGDMEDPELFTAIPLQNVRVVISTISDMHLNLGLLKKLREMGYTNKIALTVHHNKDGEKLKDAGADIILYPYVDAANELAKKLKQGLPDPDNS
jgi:Kef-type K+ transport system membrane component KefB